MSGMATIFWHLHYVSGQSLWSLLTVVERKEWHFEPLETLAMLQVTREASA